MGFISGKTYTSTSMTLTMPYTCNFNGIQSLNIVFENINTKNIDSYTKSNSSIIQTIPVDVFNPQITYNKSNDFNFTITQQCIDSIQIDLKDNLENFINLNNQNFNLTLYFTNIKDISRFHYMNNF
jgi:hypothetical protein